MASWRDVSRGVLVVVALVCGFLGTVVLPVLPGYLNWESVGESASPVVLQPQTLVFAHTSKEGYRIEEFFNLTATLSFPQGGTYSVGNPMLLNVTIKLPEDIYLASSYALIDVVVDGAVFYGTYSAPLPTPAGEFPSSGLIGSILVSNVSIAYSPLYVRFFLPNKGDAYDPNRGAWVETRSGSALLDYPTPGSFGLAVSFYQENLTKGGELFTGYTLHTAPFISVISNDTIITQRNNAYTLSLALYVITFAAIQVCVEIKPKPAEKKNSEAQPTSNSSKKRRRRNAG